MEPERFNQYRHCYRVISHFQERNEDNGRQHYLQPIDSGTNVIIVVKGGKAYMGKSLFKSKPDNLYRLTVGNEMELGKTKYRITDIK